MDFHYNAFISYRHAEVDSRIAEEVQTRLERYRLPAAVQKRTGIRRIDRIACTVEATVCFLLYRIKRKPLIIFPIGVALFLRQKVCFDLLGMSQAGTASFNEMLIKRFHFKTLPCQVDGNRVSRLMSGVNGSHNGGRTGCSITAGKHSGIAGHL